VDAAGVDASMHISMFDACVMGCATSWRAHLCGKADVRVLWTGDASSRHTEEKEKKGKEAKQVEENEMIQLLERCPHELRYGGTPALPPNSSQCLESLSPHPARPAMPAQIGELPFEVVWQGTETGDTQDGRGG